MRRSSVSHSFRSIAKHGALMLAGLFFLGPFAYLLLTSVKTIDEIFAVPFVWWPEHFFWDNYSNAVNAIPFFQYTLNTVFISLMCVLGELIAAPLVAYGFARIPFQGRKILFMIMMGTMMLPSQTTMIPLYVLYHKMDLVNTFWPLILPAFFGAAYYIFLLRQFFMGIPYELTESAKIDGASEFRIYWQMILPLSKPALFTVGLLVFLGSWKDYQTPLIYLNEPDKWTLSVGLKAFIGEYNIEWGMLMAAAALFTIPIVILYFFVQKVFIQGITLTGMK
ncbi:carbohydrate ABC transporter permease [Paenibacillus thiaminolyticus]|uniref:carbohydrate ABC transporter permease n=1 Tax=Paenibacillus thiaminolyticus TaxID=49283 RepID=UPI0023310FB4|nr:carbohydrate ABC transporter permease [Paenibacillus thiaminolyticus]WCF11072.1 carbohydrate ABC transporter permease [Paenibacillus thiaminolyticus]